MAKKFKNFTFSQKRWNESRMDASDIWQKMQMGAVITWHQAKNGTMLYHVGKEKVHQCSVMTLLDRGLLKSIRSPDGENGVMILREAKDAN